MANTRLVISVSVVHQTSRVRLQSAKILKIFIYDLFHIDQIILSYINVRENIVIVYRF